MNSSTYHEIETSSFMNDEQYQNEVGLITTLLKKCESTTKAVSTPLSSFELFLSSLNSPNKLIQANTLNQFITAHDALHQYQSKKINRYQLNKILQQCGDIGACLNSSKIIGGKKIFSTSSSMNVPVLSEFNRLREVIHDLLLKNIIVKNLTEALKNNEALAKLFNESQGVFVLQPSGEFEVQQISSKEIAEMLNDQNGKKYRYRNPEGVKFDWEHIKKDIVCKYAIPVEALYPKNTKGEFIDVTELTKLQREALRDTQILVLDIAQQQYELISKQFPTPSYTASATSTATNTITSTSTAAPISVTVSDSSLFKKAEKTSSQQPSLVIGTREDENKKRRKSSG